MCPENGNASARPGALLSVLDSTVWFPNRTGSAEVAVVAALLVAVIFAVVFLEDDFLEDFLAVECFLALWWGLARATARSRPN